MPKDLIKTADNGIRTINDKYARVKPRERPNPGSTRDRCDMITPQREKADLKRVSSNKTEFRHKYQLQRLNCKFK